tara:strand:+ start:611 stop:850 length:240 start_codon:yes stop_codon:yes gene_type:complete
MCIICVELEKSLITPFEAEKNLKEMQNSLDLEHFLEVEEKIEQIDRENHFISLLNNDNTEEMCTTCYCDPCDCLWGTDE